MTPDAVLPITALLADIKSVVRDAPRLIIQAPPGAGKTTIVPPSLLNESWLNGRKILMLEPRRLAARAAARRMADLAGEPPGGLVGYRTRLDSCAGPHTRIEVLTDGVLTRMLQSDPELCAAGLVIFDEFHERSLQADLGLALLLDAQAALRPDLRIIVMSATLDVDELGRCLQAEVLSAEGRCYDVATHYRERVVQHAPEQEAVHAVLHALCSEQGSALVFLPGAAEIRRTAALLAGRVPADVQVLTLYGNLSRADQDRAILPPQPGMRKVVLATSIAETSLTIEGVRVVIDSGLARVPRYDAGADMTRLATLPVSRAGADQRRGRAGRSEPGVCFRLWTREQDRNIPEHYEPEIKNTDLAACALELALWGVADPAQLCWVTPPPPGAFRRARMLLRSLNALDTRGCITSEGRRMAGLGLHPRLAHMALRGLELGLGALACDLAALLGERDVLRFFGGACDADIRLRLEALRGVAAGGRWEARDCSADAAACRMVLNASTLLQKKLGAGTQTRGQLDCAGVLLAHAWPDRIAQRKTSCEYLLSGGRRAVFPATDALGDHEYLAVATLDGAARRARIFLAAPLERDDIEKYFQERILFDQRLYWDVQSRSVTAERTRKLGRLVLRREVWPQPDPECVQQVLLSGIRELGIAALPWTDDVRQWQARVMLVRAVFGADEWPDVSDGYLAEHLEHWLGPYLGAARSPAQVRPRDLQAGLNALVPPHRLAGLDALAPRVIMLPCGRRARLQYQPDGAAPVLAARIQDLFGLHETPRVAGGRVRVLMHLLSPAMRPVQITSDLAGFWVNSYHAVKKDLKGRYPKHSWPDDPLQAQPETRRQGQKKHREKRCRL